ncbi:uncharacterized protein LOC126964989 [Leptidea sinapis]|uniref:uncharacterized protein LOC126964989 n=1 Tax=Leptidea sinapis TaxID=189913 RepID=UPI0021C3EC43|nr:uncharacterized protein LOC126964989 [Leptidea sinapis]
MDGINVDGTISGADAHVSVMASTDDDLAIIGLIFTLKEKKVKRKNRSIWCKEWLMKIRVHSHVNLLAELKLFPKDWHNFLRMDHNTYLHLLNLVAPIIEKQHTIMRNAIPPHDRLVATLRFLSTGRNYEDLKFSSIISSQALGRIIPETCEAIYKVPQRIFLQFPRSKEEWKDVAKVFEKRWNFPHCLGAMDGKHIAIFLLSTINISTIKTIIAWCYWQSLMEIIDFFYLCIPTETVVANSTKKLPYVFVADDAFPLRTDLTKPFRQADLTTNKTRILNYKQGALSKMRLGSWHLDLKIYTIISLDPKRIESVVMASCALHNYVMKTSESSYCQQECFDVENVDDGSITQGYDTMNSAIVNLQRRNLGNTSIAAKKVREEYMEYFASEGSVPWQNNFIR